MRTYEIVIYQMLGHNCTRAQPRAAAEASGKTLKQWSEAMLAAAAARVVA
jgi:hypothetical protein